jgi:hypothetical protein
MVHLSELDAGLPLDALHGAYLHILDRVRNRKPATLGRVLELVMTADRADVLPPVLFNLADYVSAVRVCNSTQ